MIHYPPDPPLDVAPPLSKLRAPTAPLPEVADIDAAAPTHPADPQRLDTLRGYGILDSGRDPSFDEITAHVARICDVPMAIVTLVEDDRQWFKAARGIDLDGTGIEDSMCVHAMAAGDYLEIPDTTLDPRTRAMGVVTGDPHARFYAGAVLRAANGHPLGALCVLDTKPRRLDADQRATLQLMGRQVMRLIELHRALNDAEVMRREIDHRVKNSLQAVSALIKIRRRRAPPAVREALVEVETRIRAVALMHETIYRAGSGAQVSLVDFLGGFHEQMRGLMPENVAVDLDLDPLALTPRRAMSLAMIVAEFVSNSLKHGFPDGEGGRISIVGRARSDGYLLALSDDGAGLAGTVEPGIGLQVIRATAAQIDAELLAEPPPETGYRLALRLALMAG